MSLFSSERDQDCRDGDCKQEKAMRLPYRTTPPMDQRPRGASLLLRGLSILALASCGTTAAHADCVPVLKPGFYVNSVAVTLNVNDGASYVQYFTFRQTKSSPPNVYPKSTSMSSDSASMQLWNNRFTSDSNPFDINQGDKVAVTVFETRGIVSLTFTDLKNQKLSFTGACDPSTNILYGSGKWSGANGNTMYLMHFDVPQQVPH
jgi:hypothetical protein